MLILKRQKKVLRVKYQKSTINYLDLVIPLILSVTDLYYENNSLTNNFYVI